MKLMGIILVCIYIYSFSNVLANDKKHEVTQETLDQACEVAREEKLAPQREKYIQECIEVQKKEKESCVEFYSDYGAKSGKRAPLFYDLPACEKAFEHLKKH